MSRKRVIRLMQAEKIVGVQRRRYRSTTMSNHDQPVAANLLDRNFKAERPNQKWVGDTTELITGEGRLYLAAVVDLFSRFVVGWAVSASNNRHLTVKALELALQRRGPAGGLLHHSDRGSTYASEDYQDALDAAGITCSMSRRGNCYDNAAMESCVLDAQVRAGRAVRDERGGQGAAVRLHRGVPQPAAAPLGHRLRQPGPVRAGSTGEAGGVVQLSTGPDQLQLPCPAEQGGTGPAPAAKGVIAHPWDNRRWVRFRSTIALLEKTLRSFAAALIEPSPPGVRSFKDMLLERPGPPPSYPYSSQALRGRAKALADALAAAPFAQGESLSKGAPRPEPELGIVPRV